MQTSSPTYYELLGVDAQADQPTITRAFRQRAKDIHPDRNTDAQATWHFQQLNRAQQTLRNPKTRAAYDQILQQKRQGAYLMHPCLFCCNIYIPSLYKTIQAWF